MAGGVTEKKGAPIKMPGQVVITIGVHADDGGAAHNGGEGLTVADVGTFHEFGTRTIPQRSFIRAWFDENQEFIRDTLRKQFAPVAQGKRTADVAAERCALAFEGAVKQRIARGIPPPLAPATIAAKKSSKPLVDTGQLRAAVRGRAEVK
jgi:hypothetical protein